MSITVRMDSTNDKTWIRELLTGHWHSTTVVSCGRKYDASQLPALIAERNGVREGLLTYTIEPDGLLITTIDALVEGIGVGQALMDRIEDVARSSGVQRIYLTTTNDNRRAQQFYEARGYHLVHTRKGALAEMRKLKPEIPEIGYEGVPISDELEYEKSEF